MAANRLPRRYRIVSHAPHRSVDGHGSPGRLLEPEGLGPRVARMLSSSTSPRTKASTRGVPRTAPSLRESEPMARPPPLLGADSGGTARFLSNIRGDLV